MIELNVIKEIFTELCDRFLSTENLQAVITMLNYFEDFDFGFDDEIYTEIISCFADTLNALENGEK